jgi:hypothetical protein
MQRSGRVMMLPSLPHRARPLTQQDAQLSEQQQQQEQQLPRQGSLTRHQQRQQQPPLTSPFAWQLATQMEHEGSTASTSTSLSEADQPVQARMQKLTGRFRTPVPRCPPPALQLWQAGPAGRRLRVPVCVH